ncbi:MULTISPECIES: hypothetical protein [unclassified Sphingomonas]|uniref:hypothetical protein n=1 Tax=unclassified Sphingomonas TaxID=196159 RepID=UPI0021513665|nr:MULTISPECIES: hypothetical protein [unclassified Sphingomonas]MCR5872284.1 hypothetical protein [Sphingomonas sp. J344]UUX99416.1 hypothetical protein LRS08_18555 [Sphingomonas sp. J315]
MTDFSPMTLAQGREHVRFANSYNRLGMVIEIAWRMEDGDWMTLLGEEWTTCDNIGLLSDDLLDTPFGDTRDEPGLWRNEMMTAEERAAFEALPDQLTVYRGCYRNNKWGLSWSLERDQAERFPFLHRYQQDDQALLVRATIAKSDMVALKGDRREAEVICWRPKHISTSKLRR